MEPDNLFEMLMPYAHNKQATLESNRFAYYTSADTARKIIANAEIWMRNATCMSDYSEIQIGLQYLERMFFHSQTGARFRGIIDSTYAGASKALEEQFFRYGRPAIQFQTYITCLSEHRTSEDNHGRLSMWRAYGRGTGVALVIDLSKVFDVGNSNLKAYTSPVAYLDYEQFEVEMGKVVDNLARQAAHLQQQVGKDDFHNNLYYAFLFAAVCTKHPGFEEEAEWRVIHVPQIYPSPLLEPSAETIDGLPQTVYKIPLKDNAEHQISGIAISDLIDRVIIGPTQYASTLYDTFARELARIGVPDPHRRISVSGIPLRS